MFKKILIFLICLTTFNSLFANSELPFTDINNNDELYEDLLTLYKNNILKKTSDNKFHPDSPIQRDEFVGIVVWVGCKDCLNPLPEDILKYTLPPFPDVTKLNPYFYCISIAKDKWMTQGYILDNTWKHTCDNWEIFTTSPFCPNNKITRIEAATILLRSANLWNDELNTNITKWNDIVDVDNKWYWFAKKAIEIGLIKINSERKIFPNENITRREFVHMAVKIFSLNLCTLKDNSRSDFSSEIKIFDKTSQESCTKTWQVSDFSNKNEKIYDFFGYTEKVWDFEYSWEFTNNRTNEIKIMSWKCLDNFEFSSYWERIIKLVIKDKKTLETSTSYSQINIVNNSWTPNNWINVTINADPLITETFSNINFNSIVKWWSWELNYSWSFWDWTISEEKNPTHKYQNDWVYTVILKVTDENWNTWISQINVEINKWLDTDNDWIKDKNDLCPQVKWSKLNNWCPNIAEYTNNWNTPNNSWSTNIDWEKNNNITWDIKIFDNDNPNSCIWWWEESHFSDTNESIFDFYWYTETKWNFEYIWEFKNVSTNEVITASWKCLNNYDLISKWKWIVKLIIKDKDTWISQIMESQITISNNNNIGLSVNANVDKLSWIYPSNHKFNSIVYGWIWEKTYKWNFGDWETSSEKNPEHIYKKPWYYNAILTVIDSKWNKWTSNLKILITEKWMNDNNSSQTKNTMSACIQKLSNWNWIIEWLLVCNSCPCIYNINFLASIRNCDILFPAITNPSKDKIYSRWPLFEVMPK